MLCEFRCRKISVEQSLIAYTRDAAYAAFDEKIKGTLSQGKLADFVILSEDITKIEPTKIKEVKVLETYIKKQKVFELK